MKGIMEIVRDVFYQNSIAEILFYQHDSNILSVPQYRNQGGGSKGFNLIELKSSDNEQLRKEIDDLADEIEIMEANYGKDNQKRTETLARKTTAKQQLDA